MRTYLQRGDVMKLKAPYNRDAGQGALVGQLFGVAMSDVTSGDDGEFMIVGVHALDKVGSQAWTQGDLIYWDDTNKYCTKTSTSNTRIGIAAADVGSGAGETTGDVRLNGVGAPTGA